MVKIKIKKEPLAAGKKVYVNVHVRANDNPRKSLRELTYSNIPLETYDGNGDGVHTYAMGPYDDEPQASRWVAQYLMSYQKKRAT